MSIDSHFKAELLQRINLSDLIGNFIKVTRAGREFKALCPFHSEKTPSFTINDDKGFYHCFGCGAHGDAIGFLMEYSNLTFIEAVRKLCQETGMTMPEFSREQLIEQEKKAPQKKLLNLAHSWFMQQLWQVPAHEFALNYLLKRGLSKETIQQFGIGYAPNDWDGLGDFITQSGFQEDMAIELGLLKKSQKKTSNGAYAFFRGRIMFPVFDATNQVVAFGGRHLDAAFGPRDLNHEPAKYMNSPDHGFFHKGQTLYNLPRAMARTSPEQRQDVTQALILAEGYMDVIALAQAGIKRALAPMGTAVTPEQIQLLWQIQRRTGIKTPPILCFDGDSAGERAAFRALERALPNLSPDNALTFVFLPTGEDPDSYIKKHGAQAITKLMETAHTTEEVMWRQHLKDHTDQTPEALAKFKKSLKATIDNIKDFDTRKIYGQRIMDKFYQYSQSLRNKSYLSTSKYNKTPQSKVQPIRASQGVQKLEQLSLAYLGIILNNPHLLNNFSNGLKRLKFTDAKLDDLKREILTFAKNEQHNGGKRLQKLKDDLSNQGFADNITHLDLILKQSQLAEITRTQDTDRPEPIQYLTNIHKQIEKKYILDDIAKSQEYFSQTLDEETYKRIEALKSQLAQLDEAAEN